jgi:hypothetical protein
VEQEIYGSRSGNKNTKKKTSKGEVFLVPCLTISIFVGSLLVFSLSLSLSLSLSQPKTPNPAVMLLTQDPRLSLPTNAASSISATRASISVAAPSTPPVPARPAIGRAQTVNRNAVTQQATVLGSPSNPIGRPSVFNPNLSPPSDPKQMAALLAAATANRSAGGSVASPASPQPGAPPPPPPVTRKPVCE